MARGGAKEDCHEREVLVLVGVQAVGEVAAMMEVDVVLCGYFGGSGEPVVVAAGEAVVLVGKVGEAVVLVGVQAVGEDYYELVEVVLVRALDAVEQGWDLRQHVLSIVLLR